MIPFVSFYLFIAMICFVNAKINIGLQIVNRRPDGFHDLQTVFYPIGLYAGTPDNPVSFCDVIEILPCGDAAGFSFSSDCDFPDEKNLVYKAARLFYDSFPDAAPARIQLEKHIPDGAGIGGGSADAAFTIRMLNEMAGSPASEEQLARMALGLGADCPFFLFNRPSYASGVGEKIVPLPLDLSSCWLLLVKPDLSISTAQVFFGVTPRQAEFDLRNLPDIPVGEWRQSVHNDFEDSIFPLFPQLAELKTTMYSLGADYASLTGSGSCVYGIFADRESAAEAASRLSAFPGLMSQYLLKL